MDEIERHLDQAHICWIGGYSRDEPFYFKVHSPVTLLEGPRRPVDRTRSTTCPQSFSGN
jgi:hypothetical protein